MVGSQIWDDFLTIMRQEVGSRVIETWFKAVTLQQLDVEGSVVYLEAPNQFVKDWIKNNYLSQIQFHIGRLLQVHQVKVIILDARASHEVSAPGTEPVTKELVPAVKGLSHKKVEDCSVRIVPAKSLNHINKNYLFDSFVVGPDNCMAYAAARAVVENPGGLYNPLCICSGSGLGKTHLLHAIGNGIKSRHQKSVVIYQAADRFVHEFVHAVRSDRVHQFHLKYKHIDVLLVDDIQFISRAERTQEAFFHIFNSLYDVHKQIVISADMPPRNLKGLHEGLQSRLSWGLVADMSMPSVETKIAILKKKAESGSELLQDSVVEYIASCKHTSIRELEGALVRVVAFASLTKQKITQELVKKVLGAVQINDCNQQVGITVEMILKNICARYPYTFAELKSKNRDKDLAYVRHLAIFLVKKYTDKSLREIGRFFGGRDHATILYACQRMEREIQQNAQLQELIGTIEASCS